MIARKRFGQHFLHDPAVIERIVRLIDPRPGDRMLEIGPGGGALTLPLLRRLGRLQALEIDRDLIPRLEEASRDVGELQLHQVDALRADYTALAGGEPLRLVGNLPYNISSPLLFRLLACGAPITDMHFMLQREVVDRLTAAPGTRTYGRLTVAVAARAHAETLLRVGRGAFTPPPAVESAIVRLTPRPPTFAVNDLARFDAIVTRAFSQRRKTLKNALGDVLDAAQIAAAGIDPGLRPERLSPADFAALANTLPAGTGDKSANTRQ